MYKQDNSFASAPPLSDEAVKEIHEFMERIMLEIENRYSDQMRRYYMNDDFDDFFA